ncbi:DYW domain containing protein [Parasponia andersonii]|uniref:DYW domain containing protein n=1 Tax=Parasponia andersonii TaxID=3476 RepID=A0A2P5APN9_PARAD|nr:DYW domain containing protein [Parasponia andersonii]
MGSEKKSKEKKIRKRRSSSSSSEGEGRRKRQKSVEDEEEERRTRKHSSSDKKEKLKDKKSSKDKKSKDNHRGKHRKGDRNSNYEFHELSSDDYFLKNNEFATWLKDEKKIFFSDLSSESAREMFADFVKAWNKQKLDKRYYEGIESGPRTAHKWKIKVTQSLNKEPKLAGCCRILPASARVSSLPQQPSSFLHLFHRRSHLNAQVISVPCVEEVTDYGIKYLSCHPNREISNFAKKGFSEITKEKTGRALHGLCLKGFVPFGVFYSNTLVNMYSSFGRIGLARYVFDDMSERNEASWNTMMSGYVRVRAYSEAIGFFKETLEGGVRASSFMVASLVTACDKSASMFGEGLQVHGFLVKVGLLGDVFVGTSLLHFYGICGLVSDAQKLFEEMPERNVVTWTSLMVGYSDKGDFEKVVDMYRHMRHERTCGNENTIAVVLKTCGLLGDEFLGLQVLGHVLKAGLETNVSVANSLIAMFGSHGNVDEACYVFDCMVEHDTISWNSIISAYAHNRLCEESLRCFYWMRHVHKEVNSTTVSTLLTVCSSVDNLKWGRGLHGLVMKMGLQSNVCVGNTLLNMYSEAGKPEDAELVFERMPERDLISWNSMVACYVQNEESQKALDLFAKVRQMRKTISYVTVTSALTACSNKEFIVEGKILHALAIIAGLQTNLVIGNALVTMYGKSGLTAESRNVLRLMPKRDEVTWNALIGCHAENEEPNEALEALNLMKEEGIPANYITIINLLGSFSTPDDLQKQGMSIHGHILQTGFDSDKSVQTSLITMYAKCGDLSSSSFMFDRLSTTHSITWNAIIAANAHHGRGEEVLKLILKMISAGMCLDQFSLSVALSVSADLAILEEGQQLHGLVVKLGFESDHYVTNAAMDMYGKCGEMDDVLRILPSPFKRSRLSWNTLISSFARHGCFQKAKETLHEMLKWGEKPDHVTFVSLLSACSHRGLVDEGLEYYASMQTKFSVPPAIEHCCCIIDLLGRSGRLAEAEDFIKQMPVPPNDLVWRSLLSSCKIHRNLELGRRAAERLLELDPSDDSAYVLYSNVCATTGRWDDVESVRTLMGTKNIKKQPACSWVKLKNQISKFGMGEKSHPQIQQINNKLGELMKMIREAGYVADTSYALHDTDEEQKEHNLWNHSERIALAFSLINTPEGSTIKVFKNLRVCGDCHSVFKFVSGIVGRKIVLRDPFRFHQFSDGKCSCSDYW